MRDPNAPKFFSVQGEVLTPEDIQRLPLGTYYIQVINGVRHQMTRLLT